MNLKLFNKWETGDIIVSDPGLRKYINLKQVIMPRTLGRESGLRFHKNKYHIVERLMNKLMTVGHKGKKHFLTSRNITGKYNHAYKIVLNAFKKIEETTKENPVKVFVKALENAAPREEITTIEYGGARYSQAVECAPQRRIDFALRQITQGAYHKSFNKKKKMEDSLSEEIINAYNLNNSSQAISKKLEIEKQADSSR